MADEKKPEAKPEKGVAVNVAAEIVSLFIVLLLISALFNSIASKWNLDRLLSGHWSSFTPKGILLSHTRSIASLTNPIGASVISINSTDVYNSPVGKKIGSQRVGARGRILQGPVVVDSKRYWYVDFYSGSDGWVEEGNIAYLETEPNGLERFLIWLFSITGLLKLSVVLFSILCFLYILYLNYKITPIKENERALLYPIAIADQYVINPKWEKIENHINSLNENDWRIAIIEADIMLGELLEKLSLPGDTIGEKLKAVEKSDFNTLDDAWEAHKIRNRISHDGQTFMINQREAKVVIGLYKKVFQEFQMV